MAVADASGNIDLDAVLVEPPDDHLLALDETVTALAREDPDAAALVKLRAFAAESQILDDAWNDVLIAELALHDAEALMDPASTSQHDKARGR